jgi:hypothetical protein
VPRISDSTRGRHPAHACIDTGHLKCGDKILRRFGPGETHAEAIEHIGGADLPLLQLDKLLFLFRDSETTIGTSRQFFLFTGVNFI